MKTLFLIAILFFAISCNVNDPHKYEITVEVHYPTRIDTIKFVDVFLHEPTVMSDKGSNTIYAYGGYLGRNCISTTAPIHIIESKRLE